MEWYVYYFDFNAREMRPYNALACEKVIKHLLKKSDTKSEFSAALRKEMMWRYWSKCEWEVVLEEWTGREDRVREKIDVYDQLCLNWDRLVDYCWGFKKSRPAKSR